VLYKPPDPRKYTFLDIVSFVGYPLAVGWWPELFAPPA